METILVTGGAGYIGSATAHLLTQQGYSVHVLDNFSTSPKHQTFPTTEVDLTDLKATQRAWDAVPKPHGVIHFAAHALVGESVKAPHRYYRNNLLAALNVAQCAREFQSQWLVHSSSCAVYGKPGKVPITEEFPLSPLSPYGRTKVMAEQILDDVFNPVLHLRYFNPVGAVGPFGETHDPETHLVPNAVRAALTGKPVSVFGLDYPTPDGTCIRDYVPLIDLAHAHVAAVRALTDAAPLPAAVNLGAGQGISVLEVLALVEKITGKKIAQNHCPRRPGDPSTLLASIGLATKCLKWQPKHTLEQAIVSHVAWLEGPGKAYL